MRDSISDRASFSAGFRPLKICFWGAVGCMLYGVGDLTIVNFSFTGSTKKGGKSQQIHAVVKLRQNQDRGYFCP
jgi:hypothetical protein